MRRRYKKFARKTYRFLRNRRRRRENRLFAWLGDRILNRDLWKPRRHAVATGVAIGVAVSMLPPIPVQMLLAAIIAVLLRGNIPIAAATCWISNPLTWWPILYSQRLFGDWVLQPSSFDELHPTFHSVRCTALGVVVFALVLSPLAYFVTFALWDAVGWLTRRVALAEKKIEPLVRDRVRSARAKKSKSGSNSKSKSEAKPPLATTTPTEP